MAALTFVIKPPLLSAGESTSLEYRSKAKALVNFASFIEWPESSFSSQVAPFSICVLGNFDFGFALAQSTRGATLRGRQIEIRLLKKQEDSRSCQMLFIRAPQAKRYTEILEFLRGTNVLAVGETTDFLDAGGAISLMYEEDSLKFEVNLGVVREQHLTISSQLLAIAKRVVNKPEAAKS